jgi:phage terminase large subunit-like protein
MFKKTIKQFEAVRLLASAFMHILLRGGSRSGKTFIIVRQIVIRALKCKSRHVVLRLHFNHVKQAIWLDTLPKVIELCFPDLIGKCRWDKSDWYVTFPNGSEFWFGGLDDKERTEKILGKEYSTVFFNECSEISIESRDIALTRLAEKNSLVKKAFYDCNPPKMTHWVFQYFMDKLDVAGNVLTDYATMLMNPSDNIDNIDTDYIQNILEKLPPLLRARFLNGEFGSDEKDIFKPEWLLPCPLPKMEDIAAVFAFCDPAITSKELAKDNTCESGIVVLAATWDGHLSDIEVLHGFWEYQELKAKCKSVAERYKGLKDFYFGAEEIAAQQWLISDLRAIGINCLGLKPDSDKVRRAVSITDYLAEGRVSVNDLELRKQLLSFPSGKLKDLVDAFVYALRLVKLHGKPKYVDPRAEVPFIPLTAEQKVARWQEKRRREVARRNKGQGIDPVLGKNY